MLPDTAWTPWVMGALVLAVAAALAVRAVRRDRREYRAFKRAGGTAERQRYYRRWLLDALAWLGGATVVLLLAAWPWLAPAIDAGRALPPVRWIADAYTGELGGLAGGLVVGVTIGVVAMLVVPVFFARRIIPDPKADALPTVGDVAPLIPRNRPELTWGALLSVNAGVVEEALFRAALPAALFAIVPNAWVAFGVAALLFGLLHVYQGPAGMATAVVLGVLLTVVLLVSGALWLAMLVHALFDLRSLVLVPLMLGRGRRSR